MSRLYCGTSGWNYSHWKRRFYPEGLAQSKWLSYYSQQFDTVEINNSFYRLPDTSTFEHWRDETPGSFTFAVKASRYLTHMKKLKDPQDPLDRVLSHSSGLGSKRGPILYQLPPYWHLDIDRLKSFLQILPAGMRHVFEFRDDSWQCDNVWALLKEYSAAYCMMDSPDLPMHIKTTSDFSYIRMHSGRDSGNYTDDQLKFWAKQINNLLKLGDVYIYFNNDYNGYAVFNAITLKKMLQMN